MRLNHQRWQFRQVNTSNWYPARIPGTVYTDLLRNKRIPDPFYRDQESQCYWADSVEWEYQTTFSPLPQTLTRQHIDLVFDGLDTYAEVYLNKRHILSADNMFIRWSADIKPYLHAGKNELRVVFKPALLVADSLARRNLPLILPDHPRVYVRKAQCQFGWDWGPRLINAGIWKNVWIDAYDKTSERERVQTLHNQQFKNLKQTIKLIQEKDSLGKSFYFQINGKPLYIKGANWIPAHIFPTEVKEDDYRRLLTLARDANMNMLRVWGGGWYEDDAFYDLCDKLGIMVWQDLMFAGGMYPGDDHFFQHVKEEVRQQVLRLRHHPCIALWCGNNEIDEAWKNWGWQNQFNLHGQDSATVYAQYKKLFEDSLRIWINEFDGTRSYIPTSPLHGWGRKESMQEGDSHYWGLWWGLEDWEVFRKKTGRFVSEYGMQSMPNRETIERFTEDKDRYLFSDVIRSHQKANNGFNKLNHYLLRYMVDSTRFKQLSLDEYRYLSQVMQSHILENVIALHRSKSPNNMGTLLWQLNDCWPVSSWSIIDFSQEPKAAWYAVKRAYSAEPNHPPDSTEPRTWQLKKPRFDIQSMGDHMILIRSDEAARFIELSLPGRSVLFEDNFFHLRKGESKLIRYRGQPLTTIDMQNIRIRSYYDFSERKAEAFH